MDKPVLIYCYDAYCGWCYGFSPVINKVAGEFEGRLDMEVLSGGMVLPEKQVHIRVTAGYILQAYKQVEELTGINFGKDYLWHIENPEESDWYPHSEKPAIALCIFKEYFPNRAIEIATDIQHALFYEGRDLTDDEAYFHLLEKYSIHPETFFEKLQNEVYKEAAYYEFNLVKQLKVDGFPCVFVQTDELKFHMIAKGFTEYINVKNRIDEVLKNL